MRKKEIALGILGGICIAMTVLVAVFAFSVNIETVFMLLRGG